MIERFYQDNKVKDIRIGGKRVLRVLNQGKAAYPNVVGDGLVLHYDFRGYSNNNLKRGIAYDLSGSGNHGELKNFAYSDGSGYDGQGLIFDGVDDYIQLPTLGLDADDFTVMINDKIFSYRGEQVAQVNDDGEVEVGGRNLFDYLSIINLLINNNREVRVEGKILYWLQKNTSTDSVRYKLYYPTGEDFVLSLKTTAPNDIRRNYVNTTLGTIRPTSSTYSTVDGYNVEELYYKVTLNSNYIKFYGNNPTDPLQWFEYWDIMLEKGTSATKYSVPPERFTTTQNQQPIFGDSIKTLHYWSRALSDSEILKMYNLYKTI